MGKTTIPLEFLTEGISDLSVLQNNGEFFAQKKVNKTDQGISSTKLRKFFGHIKKLQSNLGIRHYNNG